MTALDFEFQILSCRGGLNSLYSKYKTLLVRRLYHKVEELVPDEILVKIQLPVQVNRSVRNARKDPGLDYDCEIAARIKEGDRKALRQFVERHIGRVHTYLLHRLSDDEGNDGIINELVAATFNEALRRIGPYASSTASTPMDLWLIRLAERNLSKQQRDPAHTVASKSNNSELRTQNSELRTQNSKPPPSDLYRFRAALSGIPNRYRAVLSLAVFEQMPAGEIAQSLGVSPARAMRRLRDALRRLNKVLEEQEKS
jgi:RNA polymerase sigma factor (sigma-70 family)